MHCQVLLRNDCVKYTHFGLSVSEPSLSFDRADNQRIIGPHALAKSSSVPKTLSHKGNILRMSFHAAALESSVYVMECSMLPKAHRTALSPGFSELMRIDESVSGLSGLRHVGRVMVDLC